MGRNNNNNNNNRNNNRNDDLDDLDGVDDSGQTYGTEEGNSGMPNSQGRRNSRGHQGGTHQQHVHAGKLGASARWGRNYENNNDNDDDMNDDDDQYDDEGGQSGRGNRQGQGGRKGQGGRGQGRLFERLSHDELVQMGKKGASARWGRDYTSDNNDEDDDEQGGGGRSQSGGGGRSNRGQGRQTSGGTQRGGAGNFANRSHEEMQQIGRKGADARWHGGQSGSGGRPQGGGNRQGGGSRGSNSSSPNKRNRSLMQDDNNDNFDDDLDDDFDDDQVFDPESGKDPRRVRAGKKAARTRGHESMAEMGRKGGQARRGSHNLGNESKRDLFDQRYAQSAY
jgi:hypothetical protein